MVDMTSSKIVRASNSGNRWCGEATLAAYGIAHTADATGTTKQWEVQTKLEAAGYAIEYLPVITDEHTLRTVAAFLRDVADGGDYVVFTNNHVMALRDNVLTDTDGPGAGMRRRVNMAWRVVK